MSESFLFQGTLFPNVPSILDHGLRPRGEAPSNDERLGLASLPDFVYLTNEPARAAFHAGRVSDEVHDGAPVAILEVPFASLNKRLLYPDEDWIEDQHNSGISSLPLEKKMRYMQRHKHEWRESLARYSTVAYRGVITGLRVWEPSPKVVINRLVSTLHPCLSKMPGTGKRETAFKTEPIFVFSMTRMEV